jgi:type IV pilus assembly protein PilY1
MNTKDSRLLKRSLCALFTGALIALQGIPLVNAKDTDVYLMSPSVARDDAPNVMIILDNSGSMDTVIVNTRPAYDPTIDYCTGNLDTLTGVSGANAGKPSNCASISGRIYWSFNSTPPSNSSSDWFTSSKNYCLNSTTALNTSGFYGSTKIARWYGSGSTSQKGWKTLNNKSDSTITYVDCQADGNTNGLAASDNKYPLNSTSTAYATSGTAFSWASFTSNATPTLYTPNYMNYWNNSALLVTKTRLDVAKDAVKSIIDANKSIRFGLMVFNYDGTTPDGGRVLMRIDTMDDARRTAMKNIVDSLTAATWTPLAETMWEAYRYFSGSTVVYGNPSPVQLPHQDSCAQNVTNSACNNGGTYDAIAAGNSAYNTGTYIAPFKYGCQTAYIIYVTDGDPTNDTSANTSIQSKIGATCDSPSCMDDLAGWMHNNDVYGGLPGKQVVNTYTIGFGGGISASGLALLQQAASKGGGKYYNADNADQLSTSLQGALTDILAVNSSFVAPSLSINAFNKLYDRDDVYFALFKPSSSVDWDGNVKRFKLCNTADVTTYGCTYGDVIDYLGHSAVDTTTSKIKDSAVSYWSLDTSVPDGADVNKGGAGAMITQNSAVPRTLYTYRGSYTGLSASAPATPITVVATSGNALYDAAINDPTILGLSDTSGSASTTNSADTTAVTTLINWMRGQDAYDTRLDNGTDTGHTGNTTEARSWNFSDPLHSRPVAITYGCVGSGPCTSTSTPIVKLFVGNNDGTIRILNADSGAEEWAFIPSEMLSSQYALAQDADGDHIYGIDDTASFWINDINNDGVIDPTAGDFVYMYVGMRRGGRNIYAFDVTPPAKLTTQTQADPDKIKPKLMWVIKGGTGNFAQLGQTWSRPKVARIRFTCSGSECDDGNPNTNDSSSRMVLIFGGGYDINQDNSIPAGPDSMGNAIYIVDPKTGQRIWWASSDTSASKVLTNMQYSIPSELTLMDSDGDKYIDRIYVGDTGGQLWRIDLAADMSDTSNGATAGYVFADVGCDSTSTTRRVHDSSGACPSGTTDQGRRKFFYPPDVSQVDDPSYSTTAYYDLVSIATGDREDPLDLLTSNKSPVEEAVHNRVYAFRDYNYKSGPPAVTPSAITETEMYDASTNQLGTLTGSSLTDEINNKVKSSQGWYIDFKEANSIALTNGLTTNWVGEKSLAKTVIYAGVIYVTTFVPANDSTAQTTCQANEGEGRYYALNYLNATPVYDLNGDGAIERSAVVGGGIPSEVIVVIRDSGVTGLVGVSGGATQTKVKDKVTIFKTYWYEE